MKISIFSKYKSIIETLSLALKTLNTKELSLKNGDLYQVFLKINYLQFKLSQ